MRGFQCEYFIKDDEGKLTKIINNSNGKYPSKIWNSCWGNVKTILIDKPSSSFIYIEKYETEQTKDSIELLLQLVNEITPCNIVTIEKKNYIEYKLLKTYDQNIILLNFIRNLWNRPGISNTNGEGPDYAKDYTDIFFKTLAKTKFKDPLSKLTKANKEACINYKVTYGPGHSNVHGYDDLKIKDSKSLLKFEGDSTRTFLTT